MAASPTAAPQTVLCHSNSGLAYDVIAEAAINLKMYALTLPIVSVGSGAADFETWWSKRYNTSVITVDNNPEYKADFLTAQDLIVAKPELVNNCCVWLIWPEPSMDVDPYDMRALELLKPKQFMIIYERTYDDGEANVSGGAASSAMHQYLQRQKEFFQLTKIYQPTPMIDPESVMMARMFTAMGFPRVAERHFIQGSTLEGYIRNRLA